MLEEFADVNEIIGTSIYSLSDDALEGFIRYGHSVCDANNVQALRAIPKYLAHNGDLSALLPKGGLGKQVFEDFFSFFAKSNTDMVLSGTTWTYKGRVAYTAMPGTSEGHRIVHILHHTFQDPARTRTLNNGSVVPQPHSVFKLQKITDIFDRIDDIFLHGTSRPQGVRTRYELQRSGAGTSNYDNHFPHNISPSYESIDHEMATFIRGNEIITAFPQLPLP